MTRERAKELGIQESAVEITEEEVETKGTEKDIGIMKNLAIVTLVVVILFVIPFFIFVFLHFDADDTRPEWAQSFSSVRLGIFSDEEPSKVY